MSNYPTSATPTRASSIRRSWAGWTRPRGASRPPRGSVAADGWSGGDVEQIAAGRGGGGRRGVGRGRAVGGRLRRLRARGRLGAVMVVMAMRLLDPVTGGGILNRRRGRRRRSAGDGRH